MREVQARASSPALSHTPLPAKGSDPDPTNFVSPESSLLPRQPVRQPPSQDLGIKASGTRSSCALISTRRSHFYKAACPENWAFVMLFYLHRVLLSPPTPPSPLGRDEVDTREASQGEMERLTPLHGWRHLLGALEGELYSHELII